MAAVLQAVVQLDKRQFETGMSSMSKLASTATSAIGLAFGGVTSELITMTRAFGPLGAAVTVIKEAITVGASFESQMAQVASVTGLVGEEFQKVSDMAREMATQTAFTATETAQALYSLGSAGFDTAKQLEGTLEPTLKLAGATLSETSLAAETLTGALASFGLEANDARTVADLFAGAIAASPLTMERLSNSFSQAAPVAAAFNMNMVQLTTSLAGFHKAGIRGGAAGTRFRQAMLEMKKAAEESDTAIGKALRGWNPAIEGMTGAVKRLEKAGITGAQVMTEFGRRGGMAVASQLKLGSAALTELEGKIRSNADVVKMYDRQMESMAGQWKLFKSAMEDLAIGLYEVLQPAIKVVINLFQGLAEAVGSMAPAVQKGLKAVQSDSANFFVNFYKTMIAVRDAIAEDFMKALIDGIFGEGTMRKWELNGAKMILSMAIGVKNRKKHVIEALTGIMKSANSILTDGMTKILTRFNLDKLAQEVFETHKTVDSFFDRLATGARMEIFLAEQAMEKLNAEIATLGKKTETTKSSLDSLKPVIDKTGEGAEETAKKFDKMAASSAKAGSAALQAAKLMKSATPLMSAALQRRVQNVLEKEEEDQRQPGAVPGAPTPAAPGGPQPAAEPAGTPDLSRMQEHLTRIAAALESLVGMKGIIWA